MRRSYVYALLGALTLVLAGVMSAFASQSPDGLERVAEDQGFASTAKEHAAGEGPLADYGIEAVDNPALSGGLAGVLGVVVVLILVGGLAYVVRRRGAGGRGR